MFIVPIFFMWQWIMAHKFWKICRACEVKRRLSKEPQKSLFPFIAQYLTANIILFAVYIILILTIHTLTPLSDFLILTLLGFFLMMAIRLFGQWLLKKGDYVPQDILKTLDSLSTHSLTVITRIRAAISTIALLLLILALMAPEGQQTTTTLHRQTLQVAILLDLSNSMNATDVYPTRLKAAKEEIAYLAQVDAYDEFGLIYFTNDSFIQSPLSSDTSVIQAFIEDVTTDYMPFNGTDFSKALLTAQELLNKHEDLSQKQKHARRILILSDGENQHDQLTPVLEQLKQNNIVVDAIGFGTTMGGQVFQASGEPLLYQNAPVISKFSETTLKQITEATGGFYIHYEMPHDAINAFIDYTDALRIEQSSDSLISTQDRVQLYPVFLIPAFILSFYLIMEPALSNIVLVRRKRRKLKRESSQI